MCGIAGSFGPSLDVGWANSAKEHLRARGPDSQKITQVSDSCLMVACRLAMTDPHPRSNQPFVDSISGNTIAFNGEIYNFRELRDHLLSKFPKESFITNSDTEVLLRHLDKFGAEGLDKLQGMFAFSYFRKQDRELWLVRDFLGKKPLYWTRFQGTLFWASSQKLLSKIGPSQLSDDAVLQFLALGYILDPTSMQERVCSVIPGSAVIFHLDSSVGIKQTIKIDPQVVFEGKSLKSLISSAIDIRTEGHESFALSLSGGVDSSIIALKLSEAGKKVHSFSSIWSDSDKTSYNKDAITAGKIALQLGIQHSEIEMPRAKEVPEFLDDFLIAMEEPNGNPTGISLFALYKSIAGEGFKLVLTGDGSDEIFCGYPRYQLLSKLPKFPILSNEIPFLNLVDHKSGAFRKMSQLMLALTEHNRVETWLYWHLVFARNELGKLLGISRIKERFKDSIVQPIMNLKRSNISNPILSLMYWDHRVWLDMESNRKLDRVSMNFSIEARSPFQDERVINWANENPDKILKSPGKKNALLMEFPELKNLGVRMDKAGFISPIGHWLRANNKLVSDSILYLNRYKKLNDAYLRYLKLSPSTGNYRAIKQLWHLVVWSRWCQIHEQ